MGAKRLAALGIVFKTVNCTRCGAFSTGGPDLCIKCIKNADVIIEKLDKNDNPIEDENQVQSWGNLKFYWESEDEIS